VTRVAARDPAGRHRPPRRPVPGHGQHRLDRQCPEPAGHGRVRLVDARAVRAADPAPVPHPGGLPGVWLVGGAGLLGCVVSFLLGFVPPDQLQTGNPVVHVLLLALATVVLSLPPFVFALLERRRSTVPG
jgi:hypothetical protein